MSNTTISTKIKRIAHLSVHGYVDPDPILGRTDTGGQVSYVLELAKHLAKAGIKVDVFTRQFEGRDKIAPVNDDVNVVRLPCGPDQFIRKEDIFPYWDEFTDNMFAYVNDNALKYDVIHGHYWDAGYVSMNLSKKLKQPFFYTAHSLGAWKREQMGGDPAEMEKMWKFEERVHWENILFREAAAHTVTTEDGKETYRRLYDFETPDMTVIPPGVDIERFHPLREGETLPPIEAPEKFVFALSRLDSNKGHEELIRAFALVRDQLSDIKLVIGGGSKNPKQPEIELKEGFFRLIKELGLEDRVSFTGYITDDDLVAYYHRCEVFVLPSKYEPFGMTTLEAMACGTPAVVTKFGGIRNDLTDEHDSLLVDVSSPEEFGGALLRILKDPELKSKIGKNGLQTIIDNFSWDSIARRHIEFYEQYL